MRKILFLLPFLVLSKIYATTWDEPWQKEIIEQSEYFVLGEIIKESDTLVRVAIKKSFGKELKGEITIDSFFMLTICSSSGGQGPEFFSKKEKKGIYS